MLSERLKIYLKIERSELLMKNVLEIKELFEWDFFGISIIKKYILCIV